MSSQHPIGTASARDYANAYAAHYTQRQLLVALEAYWQIIESHPTSPEAEYSRSQMRNIANVVIPAGELLASQFDLVRRHLQQANEGHSAAGSP